LAVAFERIIISIVSLYWFSNAKSSPLLQRLEAIGMARVVMAGGSGKKPVQSW